MIDVSGFNGGQYGDLVMNTVAAKRLKQIAPGTTISLGISKKYSAVAPLFFNHPHIDAIHIWQGYDDFPTKEDISLSKRFRTVLDPMPKHPDGQEWFTKRHQTSEVCYMNQLGEWPADKCYLEKWFDIPAGYDNAIAFAPFAGWYNPNNDKKLSQSRAEEICNLIRSLGFRVIQIGGVDEPRIKNAEFLNLQIVDSVRYVLACKCLVHTDTFIGWAASAYSHRQLGLYSNKTYFINGKNYISNIQPIGDNIICLDDINVNQIPDELIKTALISLTR